MDTRRDRELRILIVRKNKSYSKTYNDPSTSDQYNGSPHYNTV